MDVGEIVFKWFIQLWRKTPLGNEPELPRGTVKLADHADRLELLAAMLFGESIDIASDSGVGGVAGRTMFLPAKIDIFEESERNIEVYMYRAAWGSASRACGFEGVARATDPLLDALCTVLAVGKTREVMHTEFPSTADLSASLQAQVLANRDLRWTGAASGALERLIRRLLGDTEQHDSALNTATQDWLSDAALVRPRDADELRTEAERLLPRLIAVSGRGDPPPANILWGRLLPLPRAADGDDGVVDVRDEDDRSRERKVIELDRTIRLERHKMAPREDRPLFHIFEKMETAEEFGGKEEATPDMSGDASQMEDAIRELGLGTVVRTPEDPRNMVRADLVMEPTALEVGGGHATKAKAYSYPEWDYKKSAFRTDWCTIQEEHYIAGDAAQQNLERSRELLRPQRRYVDEIRAELLRALTRRRIRNRQSDGPDVDIEAMVERHADLVAGHTPPDRLYLSARRALHEVAVLVLLDTSWSTDAWIDGRRVLDIELSSLLVVAEAFEGFLDDEVAVASFRSHTRNDVRYGILKGFKDSWHQLRTVAPSLRPDGYTRIGAAVRHSTAILSESRARRKLLVILSDGKPTDYDRYEGEYGIEDVRHAIAEARQQNIHTFGIAIEKEAKLYLARMLGPGSHRVLRKPSMLPSVMGELFVDLLMR